MRAVYVPRATIYPNFSLYYICTHSEIVFVSRDNIFIPKIQITPNLKMESERYYNK